MTRVAPCLPLLLLISISAVLARFPDALLRLQHSLAPKKDEFLETRLPIHHEGGVNLTHRTLRRFANRKVDRFHVKGTSIPHVNFDVGDSWSGLLPISADPYETRKLFFWYFPPTAKGNENDLIFWTNGGPGCSSLAGFLQENGPISWQYGQAKPTPNSLSWTNLGHMLWVEQPVGTGFSQGVPNIHNEIELAAQLVGFFQQFLNIFSELKGKNFYLTGESYAGLYLPYLADYIFSNPSLLDLKVQGIWLGSPVLADDVISFEVPSVNFVHRNENVFAFNQSFLAHIDQVADSCHYTSYLSEYLTYPPPPAPFPLPGASTEADPGCDVWTEIAIAAITLNPAFNIFRIFDMPPILWDVLGLPGTSPQIQVQPVYFNDPKVKAAIHAPADVEWTECVAVASVFAASGDTSQSPLYEVLPRVIAHGARTVVVTGLADFVLISEGTRIGIQNMTWSGKQGFQSAPKPDSFIVDGVGAFGTVQSERGLTFYEVAITGHMYVTCLAFLLVGGPSENVSLGLGRIPQFNPPAAFQSMQYLLGVRATP
ncbi:Alpha/Beta hydrolase protein [Lactarius akahatsu]|uniref:Carboxypeptidase n=1 Tax=Lactarius akahatsu TaxID=416441 RepID=A0AAD4L985_9AGAM|nr:Alpha/Beta hydrolase protein [Lactarius akahatsu]